MNQRDFLKRLGGIIFAAFKAAGALAQLLGQIWVRCLHLGGCSLERIG